MADVRMDVINTHHATIAQSIFCAKNGITHYSFKYGEGTE